MHGETNYGYEEPNARKPIDLMRDFVDGKLVSVAKGYRSSKYGRLIKSRH